MFSGLFQLNLRCQTANSAADQELLSPNSELRRPSTKYALLHELGS